MKSTNLFTEIFKDYLQEYIQVYRNTHMQLIITDGKGP